MTLLPVTLIQIAAAISGIVVGVLYLRHVRKPVMIGIHLLLGAGALEQLVILLPGLEDTHSRSTGVTAAGCLAAALALGLVTSLWARGSRQASNIMVAAHAGIGAAGFLLFLAWVA